MRTFVAIADLWGLSEEERLLTLGLPSRSTYFGWLKAAREHAEINLPVDTLLRISAVLGIHKALRILFLAERDGVEWLRSPHGGDCREFRVCSVMMGKKEPPHGQTERAKDT